MRHRRRRTGSEAGAAVKAVAAVEIRRLKKAIGVDKFETFSESGNSFKRPWGPIGGDFMKYSFEAEEMNRIRSTWHRCFAYEGIKALGVIEQYECGIMDRVEGWFDTLGGPV